MLSTHTREERVMSRAFEVHTTLTIRCASQWQLSLLQTWSCCPCTSPSLARMHARNMCVIQGCINVAFGCGGCDQWRRAQNHQSARVGAWRCGSTLHQPPASTKYDENMAYIPSSLIQTRPALERKRAYSLQSLPLAACIYI
eukprot:6184583-Pleurochrysis_carterae.AAC.1